MKKIFYVQFLVYILLTINNNNINSQQSGWVWQNPTPVGVNLKSVEIPDNFNYYIVGEIGTIIYSSNQGTNWIVQSSGTMNNLNYVSFLNSSTGYVAGNNGTILKTINSGTNWTLLNSGVTVNLWSIGEVDDNTATAVGDSGKIVTTTDGGNTWTATTALGTSSALIQIQYPTALTGYIASQSNPSYLYKTTNSGINWFLQNNHINLNVCNFHFVNATTGIFGHNATTSNYCWEMTYDGGIDVGTFNCIPNGGTYSITYPTGSDYHSGLVEYFTSGIRRILRTTNSGNSYSTCYINGITNANIYNINQFSINSIYGLVCGDNGLILKSINTGDNWTSLTYDPLETYENIRSPYLKGIYFTSPTHGVAVGSRSTSTGSEGIYMVTSNGGVNWSVGTSYYGSCVCFYDDNNGFEGGLNFNNEGYIYMTNNGGLTWNSSGLFTGGVNSIYIQSGTLIVGATQSGNLVRSTNFGSSWTQITGITTYGLNKIMMADANTGYAAGSSGTMVKTTNSGVNWFLINPQTSEGLSALYFVSANTGYIAGTNNTFKKTTDAGNTWSNVNSPFLSNDQITSLKFYDNNIGIVTAGSGVFRTYNGGQSWQNMNFPAKGFIDISTVGNRGWVCGPEDKILYNPNIFFNIPSSPNLSSPVNNSLGQPLSLNLVWNKSFSTSNYRIQLSTDSSFQTNLLVNDSTVTDSIKLVSGLSNSTKYYWRVNAKNLAGTSSYSSTFNFTTILATPNPISPVSGSINQPLNLNVDWSDVPSVSSYRLQISTDSTFIAASALDTSLIVPSQLTVPAGKLINSTKYFWRVNATNGEGTSIWSTVWNFTTIIAAPQPPNLVSPVNNAIGQYLALTLLWNKSATAVNYRVQLSTDSLFNTLVVNDSTLTDSIKAVSGLTPLTYYWWRVNAKNIGGTGNYSTVYKFKTIGNPNPITLLSPANNSTNQPVSITFVWNHTTEQMSPFAKANTKGINKGNTKITEKNKGTVKGGDEINSIGNYCFDVVTDTASMAGLLRDTTVTDTTKTLNNLNYLTKYYWRVKAKNQAGWGANSVWFNLTTMQIPTPAPPVLYSPANNSVGQNTSLTLVWYKSSIAVSYRVQVATDSLFINMIVNDSTLIDSTKIISGLTPLTYYYWRVNAKSVQGGISGWSNPVFRFRTLGIPNPIILVSPANNATNQPIALTCVWNHPGEPMFPFMTTKQKLIIDKIDNKDEGDLIGKYWFDMVRDTNSMGNLLRDSTLVDTTKSLSGLSYQTKYFWRVKAKNQIGWGTFSVWFNFTTMDPPAATVNIKVIPGGFYNTSTGELNMKDTVSIILADPTTQIKIDSARVVIDSVTFNAAPTPSFTRAVTGNYYIFVYHRNHLLIASANPVGIVRGSTVSYDFTTSAAQTYGSNAIQVSTSPVRWGMIPGDANQDQFVDGLDQTIWIGLNGLAGFLPADFNGDGFVDGLDQTLWIYYNGLGSILPFPIDNIQPGMRWNVIPQKENINKNTLKK